MTRTADDPLYVGELRARADLTLAAVLRALLVVIPLVVIAGALGTSNPAQIVLLCTLLPYTLALYFLQRRGHFALCVHAIVFGLIAFAAASAALSGSIRGVGTVGLVAAITVGGIFLPRRTLFVAALLGVASIGAIAYAENAGWLPTPNYQVNAAHWAMFSFILTAVALVLSYMRSLLLDFVQRLGGELEERRKTEAALRDSEHRYRSLFQAAMDCILVIDRAGMLIEINDFGCRMLGYSREELIGGSFARILDVSKLARLLPRPPAIRAERRTIRAEQDVRCKDGVLRSVEFTASPLPDGNILAMVRDVTERRRNEALLKNIAASVSSQTGTEFFHTLVLALCRELPADMAFIGETFGDGDRVRTIACCSDGALAKNFEYALAGSPCVLAMEKRGTVIHPSGVAEQFPEDRGLAERGISGYAGSSLFDAEGKAIGIMVALTRQPIERKDFYVSMLEIFAARAAAEIERARADATVRELNVSLEHRVQERTAALEEVNRDLESANRDLDGFGQSVSHDLRGPLGALIGFAHLLRAQEAARLTPDGQDMLRHLESSANRMNSLVEGLLEFSRLGRNPVARYPVSMQALAAEAIEEVRAEHGGLRAEIRVGEVPRTRGDAVLLRQVWKNLIGNAAKYSRERDPALIEVGYDAAAGAYFVRDNGAGFDMKHADKLFGVFQRLHSESEFEGNGVGLAIVHRIVQRHGGSINGEGKPGCGATFRFTLPAS